MGLENHGSLGPRQGGRAASLLRLGWLTLLWPRPPPLSTLLLWCPDALSPFSGFWAPVSNGERDPGAAWLCNPESRQQGPLAPAACGEEAVRSGQGRDGTSLSFRPPSLPAAAPQECRAQNWKQVWAAGATDHRLLPRPSFLPFQPLPWGVFHVFLAWTGVAWTWAGTAWEK